MEIKAIETWYDGILFRSRTEARWAVFFDAIGIPYSWEHEGFVTSHGPYLPDFWLPSLQMWFEVKGVDPTYEQIIKCEEVATGTGFSFGMAIGPPSVDSFDVYCSDQKNLNCRWVPGCAFAICYVNELPCIETKHEGEEQFTRYTHPSSIYLNLHEVVEDEWHNAQFNPDVYKALKISQSYRFGKLVPAAKSVMK